MCCFELGKFYINFWVGEVLYQFLGDDELMHIENEMNRSSSKFVLRHFSFSKFFFPGAFPGNHCSPAVDCRTCSDGGQYYGLGERTREWRSKHETEETKVVPVLKEEQEGKSWWLDCCNWSHLLNHVLCSDHRFAFLANGCNLCAMDMNSVMAIPVYLHSSCFGQMLKVGHFSLFV